MKAAIAAGIIVVVAVAAGAYAAYRPREPRGGEPPAPQVAEMGKPFNLRVGETAELEARDINNHRYRTRFDIKLDRVIADDRCPPGIECAVDAGVIAAVTVTEDLTALEQPPSVAHVELWTLPIPNKTHPHEFTFGREYAISLVSAEPVARRNDPISGAEYRLTFLIRGAAQNTARAD